MSNTRWYLPTLTPTQRARRGAAWMVFRLSKILERLAWRLEG